MEAFISMGDYYSKYAGDRTILAYEILKPFRLGFPPLLWSLEPIPTTYPSKAWTMTYMKKTLNAKKDKIKQQLMSFFKTPNAKHLAAKNLNTVAQKLTETVREYDKIFKYLLSQLEYIIDEKLLF